MAGERSRRFTRGRLRPGLAAELRQSAASAAAAARHQLRLSEFCEENEITLNESVKENIKEHLVNLESNFEHYFPNVEEHEDPQKPWILNPFNDSAIEQAGIPESMKETLFELSTESTLLRLQSMGLGDIPAFWQKMKQEYLQLKNMTLTELFPFASTYLCETSFSHLTGLKSKIRNRLCLENDLIVAVNSLKSRFGMLMSSK